MGRYICTLPNSTRVVLTYAASQHGCDESVTLSYMSGGTVAQTTIARHRKVIDEIIAIVREIEDGRAVFIGTGFYPGLATFSGIYLQTPHYLRRWDGVGRGR